MVAGQWREDYAYDGLNRRRITRNYTWQGGSWMLANETRFIYDGNVVIQERDSNNVAQVTYTRGLDLSGSLQGAGGIGGLLARTDTNSSTFYHADGNGNITSLMDANQYIVARYLYDPFGRTLGKWGSLADANVYRFSNKEYDANSGLYYYLYRFYDPNLQRWPNRDPIGERGGWNLYVFAVNSPISFIDRLGFDVNGPIGSGTVTIPASPGIPYPIPLPPAEWAYYPVKSLGVAGATGNEPGEGDEGPFIPPIQFPLQWQTMLGTEPAGSPCRMAYKCGLKCKCSLGNLSTLSTILWDRPGKYVTGTVESSMVLDAIGQQKRDDNENLVWKDARCHLDLSSLSDAQADCVASKPAGAGETAPVTVSNNSSSNVD